MRDLNEVTREIVDAAYSVYSRLGPGLLESVYEALLSREVEQRGFTVRRQLAVPLEVDGLRFDEAFRIDLLVDERVVVELKSIERLSLIHTKQLLTYLRLMNLQVGLVINFGGGNPEGGAPPRRERLCLLIFSLCFSAPLRQLTEPPPQERV